MMHMFFAATGRFAVRFRWPVVAAWVAATILASLLLPSLASAIKENNTDLLPTSSPSLAAARLAAPFQDPNQTPVLVVIARGSGTVNPADITAIGRLAARLAKVANVQQVKDLGDSADRQAVRLEVLAGLNLASPGPAQHLVAGLREAITASALPHDLHAHLAGPVAGQADASQTGQKAVNLGLDLSILFIVALLLIVFRALLAPLLTLAPAVLVTQLAGPVIGEASKAGLPVSPPTQVLMLILTIGAGTDYGLFLVFRVREELRAGRTPRDAVTHALARVGESITFSAATVIAALLTLLLATFGWYSGVGAPLAIALALMLLADLTLLPALLAIVGRAAFWPSRMARHRAHRLVGTHRGPRRRPSRRHARLRADRLRRTGHGRAWLPASRHVRRPGRPRRLGFRRGQRAARRPFPRRRQQSDHGSVPVPRAGLGRPGTSRHGAATARRAAPVRQPGRPVRHPHSRPADPVAMAQRRPCRDACGATTGEPYSARRMGGLRRGNPVHQPRRTDGAVRRQAGR